MATVPSSIRANQVEAVTRIAANLYEHTAGLRPGFPSELEFRRADSRFRHMLFCLATVHAVAARQMKNPDAVLNESAQKLIAAALSLDGQNALIEGSRDAQSATAVAVECVDGYLSRWSAYIEARKHGSVAAGTSIVATMLRDVESSEPENQDDNKRLWQLARRIEAQFENIAGSFVELTQRAGSARAPVEGNSSGRLSRAQSPLSWICKACERHVPVSQPRCECGQQRRSGWKAAIGQYVADERKRTVDYWRSLYGGRSWLWWAGFVAGFAAAVLTRSRHFVVLAWCLFGAFVFEQCGVYVRRMQDRAYASPETTARTARRLMLATGIFLLVLNVLPTSESDFRGGHYYDWSNRSRWALAIGAVFVVGAVFLRPEDERL